MNQRSIRLQRCSRRWQKKKLINYGIICFVVPTIDEEESFFLQFMTQADDDAVRRPCRERKKRELKTVKVNVPFNEAYQISLRICVK